MKKLVKIILSIMLFALPMLAKEHIVTDLEGRRVSLPSKINSVVTLGGVPALNTFVMVLGEGEKIISALPDFVDKKKFKYQLIFAPQLETNTLMQTQTRAPNIELILKAKPDVVISFSKSDADILTPKGIKVVLVHWRDARDAKATIKLLGELFGKQALAKEYIDFFDKVVAKAAVLSEGEKKPKVLYTIFSMMMNKSFMADWWIQKAGGISVTWPRKVEKLVYTAEDLLKYNPDIILLSSKKDIKKLKNDKRFSTLKAVKNDEIYSSPMGTMIWTQPTSEQPLTLLWALNIFYPKKYNKAELIKDTTYFYEHFFKTKLSEKEVKEILDGLYSW